MNCPICKEEPEVEEFNDKYCIFCMNCGVMYTEWHETEEEAWEEWQQLCEEPNK